MGKPTSASLTFKPVRNEARVVTDRIDRIRPRSSSFVFHSPYTRTVGNRGEHVTL
ncbi:MAG: hypothetical protein QXX29_03275 [Nitrososphaerota archaeon]